MVHSKEDWLRPKYDAHTLTWAPFPLRLARNLLSGQKRPNPIIAVCVDHKAGRQAGGRLLPAARPSGAEIARTNSGEEDCTATALLVGSRTVRTAKQREGIEEATTESKPRIEERKRFVVNGEISGALAPSNRHEVGRSHDEQMMRGLKARISLIDWLGCPGLA